MPATTPATRSEALSLFGWVGEDVRSDVFNLADELTQDGEKDPLYQAILCWGAAHVGSIGFNGRSRADLSAQWRKQVDVEKATPEETEAEGRIIRDPRLCRVQATFEWPVIAEEQA